MVSEQLDQTVAGDSFKLADREGLVEFKKRVVDPLVHIRDAVDVLWQVVEVLRKLDVYLE